SHQCGTDRPAGISVDPETAAGAIFQEAPRLHTESRDTLLNVDEKTTAVIAPAVPQVIIVELAGALGTVRFDDGVRDQSVRPLLGEELPDVAGFDGLIVTGSDLSAQHDEQDAL